MSIVEEHLNQGTGPRIALPCLEGYEVIAIQDIVCCVAEGSYTRIQLADRQGDHLVSKNIKQYEELLEEYQFRRIHRSYLVNPSHVTRIIRGKTPALVLSNGVTLNVSRRRRAILDTFAVRTEQ